MNRPIEDSPTVAPSTEHPAPPAAEEPCCDAERKTTCCEPQEKSSCCGPKGNGKKGCC